MSNAFLRLVGISEKKSYICGIMKKHKIMNDKHLLLGDEAVALGAIHAGLSGVYAYPGTPSTEITEFIQGHPLAAERNIHRQWSTNEKTAMEAALGMSYMGKRAMVCMKHVGMNVAADAFVNSAMTGTNGGLIVVAADDPSMHSSQNEQDSRFYGKFAMIPVFEPSSQQEAYDMMGYAFDYSERHKVPVLMRLVTRMAHSRAVVTTGEVREPNPMSFPSNPGDWVLMPIVARKRNETLIAQQADFLADAENSIYNRYTDGSDHSLGVIACGIAYNYLMEHFKDGCPFPVLKVSQYPLPVALVRRMAASCDTLLVLEDGQPVVEEMIRGVLDNGKTIKGRLTGEVPRTGELTPDNIIAALGLKDEEVYPPSELVVPRPPALCKGCGHRDMYAALNEVLREYENSRVFSDIGCYTLGAAAPLAAIDSTICMGASVSGLHGFNKGRKGEYEGKAVAVIGDSTFMHSGITSLVDIAYNRSNSTVIVLDNSITGMTGHQNNPANGKNIYGDPASAVNLEALAHAIGINSVTVVDPGDLAETERVIKEELAKAEPSLIIARKPCALLKTVKHKPPFHIDADKCKNCKSCMRIGCPALVSGDKCITIDNTLCVGCGLCEQLCKFDAIKE